MRYADTARRPAVTVGAVLVSLALAGATLAWRAGDASANQARTVVVAPASATVPAPTTTVPPTTIPPATTSTAAPTTISTSTTVRPKPVTTTVPRTTVPKAPAITAPPPTVPPVTRPPDTSPAVRCAEAQQWVAQRGLTLPAGWGFRCPGSAVVGGAAKWGVACWNCEFNGASWIAIDVGRIGASDVTLRHVIAHETCHANDYVLLGLTTELGADLCAALHGAPRP